MGIAHKLAARIGGRVMSAIDGPRPDRFVTSRYGVKLRANWRDRTFQYAHFGTYGRALADLLASRDKPFVFLDIGANQGLYALLAARNPHCVQAVALEPVAETFALLCDNIAANAAGTTVQPLQAALGDQPGEATIVTKSGHSGAATLRANSYGQCERIAVIDAHALARYIGGDAQILVKVDVEGAEETVIAQLLAAPFASRIGWIFHEIDERWTDPDRLAAALRKSGFDSRRATSGRRHFDRLAMRA